jgi:dipeptidase E
VKHLILASTSTLPDEKYLAYLLPELETFFKNVTTITFVPYARPNGISHDHYTRHVAQAFSKIGKKVKGLHEYKDPIEGISKAEAIFTGGGNTFILVKALYDLGIVSALKNALIGGVPYLGCSAGSNIIGQSMHTTNDMPITMPKDFRTIGLIPYNINAHYLDPIPHLKHNGESRETRIKEFHTYHETDVIGLREGSYLEVIHEDIFLRGPHTARLFQKNQEATEVSEIERKAIDL